MENRANIHIANVRGGKAYFLHRDFFDRCIAKHEGKQIVVAIKRYYLEKTRPQNNYFYGGILSELANEWGYEGKNEIEYLKHSLFLHLDICDEKHGIKMPKKVRDMSKIEMMEACDKIIRFAAQQGIVIETPEEWKIRTGFEIF